MWWQIIWAMTVCTLNSCVHTSLIYIKNKNLFIKQSPGWRLHERRHFQRIRQKHWQYHVTYCTFTDDIGHKNPTTALPYQASVGDCVGINQLWLPRLTVKHEHNSATYLVLPLIDYCIHMRRNKALTILMKLENKKFTDLVGNNAISISHALSVKL